MSYFVKAFSGYLIRKYCTHVGPNFLRTFRMKIKYTFFFLFFAEIETRFSHGKWTTTKSKNTGEMKMKTTSAKIPS